MINHTLLIWAALLPAADAAATDANAIDLAKMQGDWMVVSTTINGAKLPDEEAQTLFRTINGDHYQIFRFSKTISRGTFKIDATKKPKTIDSTPGASAKKQPILGIYEFDGKTLRICNAGPGMPRPTEFGAKAGSNQTEVVWQPEKK
jgi:uncharacterized protein (TIGR03067 family)